ncbi:hypothetical protein DPMN_104214 [Dreissena polymorpha]|uniref:Uncharacterized protein n=1 Tax=Dreissena polymorpha TaxID=45954 RepID=A0A9D4HFB7_DREPO|nr:hypothetical protein DPMN_104214 [Dreissena polymorpha]
MVVEALKGCGTSCTFVYRELYATLPHSGDFDIELNAWGVLKAGNVLTLFGPYVSHFYRVNERYST